MQNDKPSYDAFISHASQNEDEANELCAFLEKRGLFCWIAPRNVRPSRDYSEEIIEGVVNSKSLILLLSDHVEGASFVKREVERAANYNRKIFTIRLEDVSVPRSLELFLGLPHWIDKWATDYPERLEAIIAEINNTTVGASSIKSISFFKRISRFASKNSLGLISTVILLFFAVVFITQRQSQPDIPTPIESVKEFKTSNFNIKVTRSYIGSPIMLQLDGLSGRLMMSPAINRKQFEFTFEFDNGQQSQAIQTLMNATVKIDESLPLASKVTITLRDLENDSVSNEMIFPLPQLELILEEGKLKNIAQMKDKLNNTTRLNCSTTLNYASGFMLCQVGRFQQVETLTSLKPVVNKITFGYSEDKLDKTVFTNPLKTEGDLAVTVNDKDQLTIFIPRLARNLFYQYSFTDGNKSNIKETGVALNESIARRLTSKDADAPALFLSNAFNRFSGVVAPLSSKRFSKISWSQYPGIDNEMSLTHGFFHTDDISFADIEAVNNISITYYLDNDDKATYTYQFEQKQARLNARLSKIKAKPESLIECSWSGCSFSWMQANQEDIALIEDIFIGLDARQMLSISKNDMAPLISHMEKLRQPLYEKEKLQNANKPNNNLSFGTPANNYGTTLLQRLEKVSDIKINKTWKQRYATRTSPIFNYTWPAGPFFIRIAWKDGTSSKMLIYQVPFE